MKLKTSFIKSVEATMTSALDGESPSIFVSDEDFYFLVDETSHQYHNHKEHNYELYQ